MTFSPIISAAGADPDSAATDPAGTAVDPAAAVPQPAVAADSGSDPGQPATAAASYTGPASGQTGSASGQTGSASGQTGSASGQTGSPAGQPDSAASYADPYSTAQTGAATGQAGYSAAEQGGYSTDRGAYSAGSSADAAGSAQQDDAGAAWPHQTFLELGALPTAAPCARLHTTLVLWEWDLGTLVRSAGLVVSELVSNAVQASLELTGSRFGGLWTPGTPPVRMWLSADNQRVVIQVWDGSDRPPVPQPDSGRGLLLVGALSAEWGCYTPEKSSGKVVWAVVTG